MHMDDNNNCFLNIQTFTTNSRIHTDLDEYHSMISSELSRKMTSPLQ